MKNLMRNKKKQKGFTLIELLVTISIIAILTTLLTANFIGARQRGRDGQRKANMFQLQSALELYRSDTGQYPVDSDLTACGSELSNGTTVYMKKIPCDPSTDQAYIYSAEPAGCDNSTTSCDSYTLYGCLENEADSEQCTDAACASVCTSPNVPFQLTNP